MFLNWGFLCFLCFFIWLSTWVLVWNLDTGGCGCVDLLYPHFFLVITLCLCFVKICEGMGSTHCCLMTGNSDVFTFGFHLGFVGSCFDLDRGSTIPVVFLYFGENGLFGFLFLVIFFMFSSEDLPS